MRQWIQDNVEHPVRWGIILLLHFSLAIGLGVEYGWILGLLYAFVLPIFLVVVFLVYWVCGLGITVALSAVVLLFYAIPCSIGLTLKWIWGLFLKARERRKRRKQAWAICQRCGLRSDALTAEEALTLSEDDIHAVAWDTRETGRGSAENLAHVLADRKSRELLSDGLPRLYQETAKAEAKLRAQVTLVTKRAMVAKAVKILLQK